MKLTPDQFEALISLMREIAWREARDLQHQSPGGKLEESEAYFQAELALVEEEL